MDYDPKFLSIVNLILQLILTVILSYSVLIAKKKELKKHCILARFAAILQIAAILTIMLPSMSVYIENPGTLFNTEIFLHHFLGLLVIGLWIYVNLVYARKIRWPIHFRIVMRTAYGLWILAFVIGFHLYIRIYL